MNSQLNTLCTLVAKEIGKMLNLKNFEIHLTIICIATIFLAEFVVVPEAFYGELLSLVIVFYFLISRMG